MTFRNPQKSHRKTLLTKMMNLIISSNHFKWIAIIYIFNLSTIICRILNGLIFVAPQKQQDPHLGTVKQFCPCKKSTTENTWSYKEVSKRVMPTTVVRHSNTIMNYIFWNHCDSYTQSNISFLILLLYN